jgi:dUTP pyrophosphatase
MRELVVRITRVDGSTRDIQLPAYATAGSAGMDLCASIEDDIVVPPGETTLVPTGFRIQLPEGYEAQVRPRSGLALRRNVGILNSPGTIDPDYRGEIKVILSNFGKNEFVVRKGDRIAQLVVSPFVRVQWMEVDTINSSERGSGGFGHTGG